jgi:hypothetical protein
MDCLKCKNLEEAFESRLKDYIEARSAAFYRVRCELASKKYLDRENANYDLEEHRPVSALEMRCKPSKLFDSLRGRCLTTAGRKPSILVEQATSSYSFRSPELSQPI